MHIFGKRLKQLRTEQSLTMQNLSDKSGVSKSMISKIEREEVQPTLDVAVKLAQALGKTLTEVLHESAEQRQIIYIKEEDQPIWLDQTSKASRRIISPVFEGLKVESIIFSLPPLTSLGRFPPNPAKRLLYMLEGHIRVIIEPDIYELEKGDSFYFQANVPYEVLNSGAQVASYLMVVHHR